MQRTPTRFVNLVGPATEEIFRLVLQLGGYLPAYSDYRCISLDSLCLHFETAEIATLFAKQLSHIMDAQQWPLRVDHIHVTVRWSGFGETALEPVEPLCDQFATMSLASKSPLIWRIPSRQQRSLSSDAA